MTRVKLIAVIVLATAAATLGGTWAARVNSARGKSADRPTHGIVATHIDFGEVWESDRFEWSLPVSNTGSKPAELTAIRGSCDCTTIDPSSLSLPPGASGTIRLKIDLRPKTCERTPSLARKFAVTIRADVAVGGRSYDAEWIVEGTVKRPFLIEPVDFGRRSDIAKDSTPIVVPIPGSVELEDLSVEGTSPSFRAAVRDAKSGTTRYELVVTPSTDLPRGQWSHSFKLLPVAPGGLKLPPVAVAVSMEVASDIEAVPERLLIGAREVSTEHVEILSLRSLSNRAFVIEDILTQGAGLNASRNSDGTMAVRIRIMQPGAFSGSVKLRVRPQGAEPASIDVRITGHGIAKETP